MPSVAFIRDMARKLLKEFAITTPPVPVADLIAGQGLRIEQVQREDAYSGELIPEQRKIKINARKPHVHQRFTMAHELGHWVLYHKERLLETEQEDPGNGDLEESDDPPPSDSARKQRDQEANEFAAELLMPTKWIKANWRKLSPDAKSLAQLYDVSEQAMWIQLMKLGLVK
jgi:Zn-dependent peptidase ImmA (M78 family)